MRQVFVDTETTGLSAEQGDRIVEIGCVELVDRRSTGRTLHHYVNPQRSSHPDALRVHGITDDFLADKPPFASIAEEVREFVGDAEIIIHNAAFDVAFIDAELQRAGHPPLQRHAARITCSLQMAREIYPGKSNSLDALCRRLEVDNSRRELHGALLDAGLLAEVYLRMTRGQDSLVIEATEASLGAEGYVVVDLSQYVLAVVEPSAEELEAHTEVLAAIDKASGGRTLWRRFDDRETGVAELARDPLREPVSSAVA